MRYDCFISYASEDFVYAEKLHLKLTNEGFEVWMDKKRLKSGCLFDQEIKTALDNSQIVIPILTPFWRESEWAKFETYRKDNIIPVLASGSVEDTVPETLRRIHVQTIDFIQPDENNWTDLFLSIYRKLGSIPVEPDSGTDGTGTEAVRIVDKPQNLPYLSLGKLFKGRDEMLKKLRGRIVGEAYHDERAVLAPLVLHGLGGVGKTRLAIEFAWRYQADFSALLFVTADSVADLYKNLAALTGPLVLNLSMPEEENEEVRMAAALRWLAKHPTWLLIIDNVDTEETAIEVQNILSRLRGGLIVITAKIVNWSPTVELTELDVLEESTARDFLLARTESYRTKTSGDKAEATLLAHKLDGLALALEQAGAYISKSRMSFTEYIDQLDQNTEEMLEWYDELTMGTKKSVVFTWKTTFERVSKSAQALLQLLGWLAPDPIPLILFHPNTNSSSTTIGSLVELEWYSLAKRAMNNSAVVVHRLVQEITRKQEQSNRTSVSNNNPISTPGSSPTVPMGLTAALTALDQAIPRDITEENGWKVWTLLQPHVTAIIGFAEKFNVIQPTARLCRELGFFLFSKAVYTDAEQILRKALAWDEMSGSMVHADVALDLVYLSMVLRSTKRANEAEDCIRRAMQIDEAIVPNNLKAIARDLMELGEVLYVEKRLAEREPLYRRALSIRARCFGPIHRSVAASMNNLASALQDLERLEKSEKLYRRSLEIGRRVMPPNDRELASWTNNFASLLEQMGRSQEAEATYRQAISIIQASNVPDHPNLALYLRNLVCVIVCPSRQEESQQILLQALGIRERYFGITHEYTLEIISDLMVFPNSSEHLMNCCRLLTSSSNITKQSSVVLQTLKQTAHYFENQNDLNHEKELACLIVDFCERTLETGHPQTIDALKNAILILEKKGDWDDAENAYRKALSHDRNNIIVLGNFGCFLFNQRRDFPGARQIYEEALLVDPQDAVNLTNFAGLCLVSGNIRESEDHLQKAWKQIQEKSDGYSARTLFLRAAMAVLIQDNPYLFLGLLKTVLSLEIPTQRWHPTSVLQYLEENLPESFREFFHALHTAVFDRNADVELDRFPYWLESEPVTLDTPWPELDRGPLPI